MQFQGTRVEKLDEHISQFLLFAFGDGTAGNRRRVLSKEVLDKFSQKQRISARSLLENVAGRYYAIGGNFGTDIAVEVFDATAGKWQVLPQGLLISLQDGATVVVE